MPVYKPTISEQLELQKRDRAYFQVLRSVNPKAAKALARKRLERCGLMDALRVQEPTDASELVIDDEWQELSSEVFVANFFSKRAYVLLQPTGRWLWLTLDADYLTFGFTDTEAEAKAAAETSCKSRR